MEQPAEVYRQICQDAKLRFRATLPSVARKGGATEEGDATDDWQHKASHQGEPDGRAGPPTCTTPGR
jgi:hypothetical protein